MADYGSIGISRSTLASISGLMPTSFDTIVPNEDLYYSILGNREVCAKFIVPIENIVETSIQRRVEVPVVFTNHIVPITAMMPPTLNTVNNSPYGLLKYIPLWAYTSSNPFPDTTGVISGTVKVEGILWDDIEVCLYYKVNGFLVGRTRTNELGEFSFNYLESGKPLYYVVAFKDTFNAVIMDSIPPVGEGQSDPYTPPPLVEKYPAAYTETYVKTTSYYNVSIGARAVNPNTIVTGDYEQGWISSSPNTMPEKFNVDFGTAFVLRQLTMENGHHFGSYGVQGAYNFEVYGSNSVSDFNDTSSNVTGLTLLGTFTANPHTGADVSDPQNFTVTPNSAFRYIIIKFLNRNPSYMMTYFMVRKIIYFG